jgi:thiamine kinase-like enzyme
MNDLLATQIRALPCFAGVAEMAQLSGGMTNRNYRVDDRSGRYVVRLGQDIPEHGVMRWHELAAARAAHATGISPEVVYAAPGVLVSRFIEGRTLQVQDLRARGQLAALVLLLQRCHRELPRYLTGPVLMFWVFQVIRNYLGRLLDRTDGPLSHRLAEFATLAPVLEQAVGPVDIVFGHNDLLAGNWIDDGQRLWLIDWEYAGFNSPLFDLANLSCNNAFDAGQDHALLQTYFGQAPDATCMRAFLAMRCASALRETLWALVSQQVSTLDVDYRSYASDWCARMDASRQEFETGRRLP